MSTKIHLPGEEGHDFEILYNVVLPVATVALAVLAIWIGFQMFLRNRWRYDIKAFNDAVVIGGNVPMDVLAKNVDQHIRAVRA